MLVLLSQALCYLTHTELDDGEKELLKQELASELVRVCVCVCVCVVCVCVCARARGCVVLWYTVSNTNLCESVKCAPKLRMCPVLI